MVEIASRTMAVIGKMMLLSIMALCLVAQSVDCRRGMMREGCDDHHKGRSKSRPGGVSEDKPKTGKEYESLEALKYRIYVVAVELYLIKVSTL